MDKEKLTNTVNLVTFAAMGGLFAFIFLGAGTYLINPYLFHDTTVGSFFNSYTNHYQNDSLVEEIYEYCNEFKYDIDKVYCVNEFFIENFEHIARNQSGLLSPQKIFEEGGLCRDAASLYCTIFKKMDLECKYLFKTKKHVVASVWVEDSEYQLCLLDQKSVLCG